MKEIVLGSGKTVRMREPKVLDIRLLKDIDDKEEKELRLIGNLCEMSTAEIENLSLRDYGKLQEGLKDFLS